MYPKWMAKWDVLWHGENGEYSRLYVWKSGERLSPHTEGAYRIFGVAELCGEELYALCMRFLREFGERFDTVLTVPHHCFLNVVKMNPLLRRPYPDCAMLVSDEEVSVLTRGAHPEVLERLGRDFKTWKKNAWLWSELSVEFFEKGTLPDDPDAALSEWKSHRPKTVFEFQCRMWEFRSEYRDVRWTTACCLYAAPAFENHVAAGRALEGWLADGFEERGVPTEWYVTGKRPDCADRFFR